MAMLCIKPRFANMVVMGRIKQIISRQEHKFNQDEKLFIFSWGEGARSAVRRLRSTKCDVVKPVFIDVNNTVLYENRFLSEKEKQAMAKDNGFDNFKALLLYFRNNGGLPVSGQLVKWL